MGCLSGIGLSVGHQLPKLARRVRLPYPAPFPLSDADPANVAETTFFPCFSLPSAIPRSVSLCLWKSPKIAVCRPRFGPRACPEKGSDPFEFRQRYVSTQPIRFLGCSPFPISHHRFCWSSKPTMAPFIPLLPPVAAPCRVLPTLPATRASHVGRLLPRLAALCRALPDHLARTLPLLAGPCRTGPPNRAIPIAFRCRALPPLARRCLRGRHAPGKTLANSERSERFAGRGG
jgi:hypothetical protein